MSGGVGAAAAVLLAVLLLGVAVGRSKRRWFLLLAGLAAVVGLGVLLRAVTVGQVAGADATGIADLYSVVVPPAVAFVAGWLCARGTWFGRLIVLAVAALLLASFPYAAAGEATAELLRDTGT